MAKTSNNGPSYNELMQAVRGKQFQPVYLLMGEEAYYIDRLCDAIVENALAEEERDFNQMTFYCTRETDVNNIINAARRYPMMAERQVVIVKEAQNLLKIEELTDYVNNCLKSTILLLAYKNGTIDRRKKLVGAVQRVGVVFESPKVRDSALPQFITEYLRQKNLDIENPARMIMAEYIGADLSRMASELDKLIIAMPQGNSTVTADMVEQNIGISKDYNNWELKNAIVAKDVLKANQIISYFNSNPKANPPFVTVPVLFNLFASVMQAHYSPVKTPDGIAQHLGIAPWQVSEIMTTMHNYSAMKTMLIIGKLRETDVRLKGVEKGSDTDADIMRELIFFILH